MNDLFFNSDTATISPVATHIVVLVVMGGLLLASIWTWAIIISFGLRIGRTRRRIDLFERDFWKAEDIDAFHRMVGESDLPVARVFSAGVRTLSNA